MPNKNHFSSTLRKVSGLARLMVLFVCIYSCSSPIISNNGITQLTLNFLLSGTNPSSPAATTVAGSSTPRLLLPTANKLTVTLSPSSGKGGIKSQTVYFGSETVVPVSFSVLPNETYMLNANAYGPDGTTILFTKKSQLNLAGSNAEVTLCLNPYSPAELGSLTEQVFSASINGNSSQTWSFPAGSQLIKAGTIWISPANPDLIVFLQGADGRTIQEARNGSSISTSVIPPGEGAYITLYNKGSGNILSSFCAGVSMVSVPPGTFQRDPTPENTSYVSAFSIGKFEVTRAQFLKVMGYDPTMTSYSSGLNDPVQNVNWYHAIAFCNKLSLLEGLTPVYSVNGVSDWAGLVFSSIPTSSNTDWSTAAGNWQNNGYRIPSENEWMWAAIGASGTGIHTTGYLKGYAGDPIGHTISDYAWQNRVGTSNSAGTTHPVGTKLPNELGLYDMSGNVWEWNWDRSGTQTGPTIDYFGEATGNPVLRGEAWDNTAFNLLGFRNGATEYLTGRSTGFRVARGTLPSVSVTYLSNGASGGTVPLASAVLPGNSQAVLGNTGSLLGPLIQDGISQRFTGWNTQADGLGTPYAPGASINVEPSTKLYAQYTKDSSLLGKIGPAGGYIFYDKLASNNSPSNQGAAWRYIEAAPSNQSEGIIWGTKTTHAEQNDWSVAGWGLEYTASIVSVEGVGSTYAAGLCDSLELRGKTDWFLPCRAEINLMDSVLVSNGLGGFTPGDYWRAWYRPGSGANFGTFPGISNEGWKPLGSLLKVRAARRF